MLPLQNPPQNISGRCMSACLSRRRSITNMGKGCGVQVIKAKVPLAKVFGCIKTCKIYLKAGLTILCRLIRIINLAKVFWRKYNKQHYRE